MTVQTIAPERAFQLLQRNECGRVLNITRVAEFAERMRRGKWIAPGSDSIAITPPEGGWSTLSDGQHRLHAIVLANCPMQHNVITVTDDPLNPLAVLQQLTTALVNEQTEEGCDRCECGCKYWMNDACTDCGTKFDPERHRLR